MPMGRPPFPADPGVGEKLCSSPRRLGHRALNAGNNRHGSRMESLQFRRLALTGGDKEGGPPVSAGLFQASQPGKRAAAHRASSRTGGDTMIRHMKLSPSFACPDAIIAAICALLSSPSWTVIECQGNQHSGRFASRRASRRDVVQVIACPPAPPRAYRGAVGSHAGRQP
jgi:hypothetical protein